MNVNSIGVFNANSRMTSSKAVGSNAQSIAFEGEGQKRKSPMVTIPLATYMAMLSIVGGGAVMQSCDPEDPINPIDTTEVTKPVVLAEVQKNTLAIVDTLHLATVKQSSPSNVSGMNRVSRSPGSITDGVVSLSFYDNGYKENTSIVKNNELSTKDQTVYDKVANDPKYPDSQIAYVRLFVTPITNGIKITRKEPSDGNPPTNKTKWLDAGGEKLEIKGNSIKSTLILLDGTEKPNGKYVAKDANTVTKYSETGLSSYDLSNMIIGTY